MADCYDIEEGGNTSLKEQDQFEAKRFEDCHHQNLRNAFLRRVYAILCLQLLVTVLGCLLFMFNDGVRGAAVSHPKIFIYGSWIPTFIALIALFWLKNKYPWNLVCLALFTLLETLTLATICALYYEAGAAAIILQAFLYTLVIFIALTIFVMQSKIDFSFLGGFLLAGLLGLMLWSLANMIFGWHASWVFSLLGCLLFCGFILYDTDQILKRSDYDDYILAAIELYLDIINLFLFVLSLLDRRN